MKGNKQKRFLEVIVVSLSAIEVHNVMLAAWAMYVRHFFLGLKVVLFTNNSRSYVFVFIKLILFYYFFLKETYIFKIQHLSLLYPPTCFCAIVIVNINTT